MKKPMTALIAGLIFSSVSASAETTYTMQCSTEQNSVKVFVKDSAMSGGAADISLLQWSTQYGGGWDLITRLQGQVVSTHTKNILMNNGHIYTALYGIQIQLADSDLIEMETTSNYVSGKAPGRLQVKTAQLHIPAGTDATCEWVTSDPRPATSGSN